MKHAILAGALLAMPVLAAETFRTMDGTTIVTNTDKFLSFGGTTLVTVNLNTGKVVVNPSYNLDEASIAFWKQLSESYSTAKKEICK